MTVALFAVLQGNQGFEFQNNSNWYNVFECSFLISLVGNTKTNFIVCWKSKNI